MANRSYLPSSHRLLTGFSPLNSLRGGPSLPPPPSPSSASNRASSPPPEFAYDPVYHREHSSSTSRAPPPSSSSRETSSINNYNPSRAPTSPGNSGLGMAYSSVQEFPYGLSGVQMPTYNFGSELYNYVSNGFPRKSRMCTFCNKVFTRSTTRRYHERRCPLLRASNSLAKNEENNQASALSALKEQQQQQHQKESPNSGAGGGGGGGGGGGNGRSSNSHQHNSSSMPRTLSNSMTNTTTAQSTGSIPQASPPLPSLHPAYPTSFPKSAAALVSSPSRSSAYNYPHPYSSHFYNSLSAAALASLEQNSAAAAAIKREIQQQKQPHQESESGSLSWKASSVSPPTPNNKLQEQVNPFGSKLGSSLPPNAPLSLSKAFTPESVADLTARYCADFSLRTHPPVFPAPSLRAPPHSPPSPEPGETHNKFLAQRRDRHNYDEDISMRGDGNGNGRDRDRDGAEWDRSRDRERSERERRSSRDSPIEGVPSMHPSFHGNKLLWKLNGGADRDKLAKAAYAGLMPPSAGLMPPSADSSALDLGRFRRQSSSPAADSAWAGEEKNGLEPREQPFMKVDPLDDDDEDDYEDEDEGEVEEDEMQFKTENGNDVVRNAGAEIREVEEAIDVEKEAEKEEKELLHTKEAKSFSYSDLSCQFCEELFPDPLAKKAHEAVHPQSKNNTCCICPASFHCEYSLRIHMTRNHKDGPYKCKHCFLEYKEAPDFATHLVKEHSLPEKEFESLTVFQAMSSSDPEFSSIPDSMLTSKAVSEGGYEDDTAAFKKLRRSVDHTEEHYKFSEDSKKAALLSPKNVSGSASIPVDIPPAHTSEKEEETEICKICSKSFPVSYIRLHERSHTDQKPYECPICNKRFGYKNNMKSHMKLHQGLKPYQCRICGARFTRGSTLRRHSRRHENKNSAMIDYMLYSQRASGRGVASGGAAASLAAHHKASMVPNSLLGAKSHYLLPNSHSLSSNDNNSANNNNNNGGGGGATTTNNSGLPPLQLQLPSHHHSHHPHLPDHPGIQTSDSLSHLHHPHPSPTVTTKHSAFGSMPTLTPAAGATLGNMPLDGDRFGLGHRNGNMKQKSPNHHLSPTGASPGASSGHHNPFTSPHPMVAALASANLFGYSGATGNPNLYQLYASAAVNNTLMGYAPFAAGQTPQSMQSDALNLSLNKRKSPDAKEEIIDESNHGGEDGSHFKDGPSRPKHVKLMEDEEEGEGVTGKMSSNSPTDDHTFVDSSSGISSSASPDNKGASTQEFIEPRTDMREGTECDDKGKKPLSLSSLSPPLSANSSPSGSPRKSLSPDCESKLDKEYDYRFGLKHRKHGLSRGSGERVCDRNYDQHQHHNHFHIGPPGEHHQDDKNKLALKVFTEDFGAQVNICCPSPRVESSTGPVSSEHGGAKSQSDNNENNANDIKNKAINPSPVGSSSESDPTTTTQPAPPPSPIKSVGVAAAYDNDVVSGKSSSVDSNTIPSPTRDSDHPHHNDLDDDLILTLLSSGRLSGCSLCEIYFSDPSLCRIHQKYHENDIDLDRPFLCRVCRKDCKDKLYFNIHLSEHLGIEPKDILP